MGGASASGEHPRHAQSSWCELLALTEGAVPSEATAAPIVSVSGLTNELAELPPETTELVVAPLSMTGLFPWIIDSAKEDARASTAKPRITIGRAAVRNPYRECIMTRLLKTDAMNTHETGGRKKGDAVSSAR